MGRGDVLVGCGGGTGGTVTEGAALTVGVGFLPVPAAGTGCGGEGTATDFALDAIAEGGASTTEASGLRPFCAAAFSSFTSTAKLGAGFAGSWFVLAAAAGVPSRPAVAR